MTAGNGTQSIEEREINLPSHLLPVHQVGPTQQEADSRRSLGKTACKKRGLCTAGRAPRDEVEPGPWENCRPHGGNKGLILEAGRYTGN